MCYDNEAGNHPDMYFSYSFTIEDPKGREMKWFTHRSSPIMSKQHDYVIQWKHFPRYCPFEWEIHRWPVNSTQKGQWCGPLLLSLICAWTNSWAICRYASAPGISYSLPTGLCGLKRAVMSPLRILRPCGIVSFGIIIGLYLITHEFKAIYSRSLLCRFRGDNFVCYSYHHRIYIKLFHAYLFQPLACSESSMKTVLFKMCLIHGLSCLLRKKV